MNITSYNPAVAERTSELKQTHEVTDTSTSTNKAIVDQARRFEVHLNRHGWLSSPQTPNGLGDQSQPNQSQPI